MIVDWWECSPWSPRDWWLRWQSRWETPLGQWLCERGGHAPGVIWYSMIERLEPDMHCKRCNKDLR